MEGYNPSVSLLPAGNGHITAMSGGFMDPPPGYNPSASLLPASSIPIPTFNGGGEPPTNDIKYPVSTINNNGTDGKKGVSNQCMLISIMHHLQNRIQTLKTKKPVKKIANIVDFRYKIKIFLYINSESIIYPSNL